MNVDLHLMTSRLPGTAASKDQAARELTADLPYRVQVGQTAGCSTRTA